MQMVPFASQYYPPYNRPPPQLPGFFQQPQFQNHPVYPQFGQATGSTGSGVSEPAPSMSEPGNDDDDDDDEEDSNYAAFVSRNAGRHGEGHVCFAAH